MTRTITMVLFAVALAMFGLGGGTLAQDEAPVEATVDGPALDDPFAYGCDIHPTQESAQAVLDDGTGNPAELDPDGDGVACNHPGAFPPDDPNFHGLTCDELPEGSDPQAALESGIADADLLDPDGDGIACNHDDEPTEDVVTYCYWSSGPMGNIWAWGQTTQPRDYYDSIEDGAWTALPDDNGNCPGAPPDGWAAQYPDDPTVFDDQGGGDQEPTADVTCGSFGTRAEAQATLDADSSDPYGLDANGNGIACDDGLIAFPDDPPAYTVSTADCGDYSSQEVAQGVLDGTIRGEAQGNPALLDPDGDGVACNHDDVPVGDGCGNPCDAPTDDGTEGGAAYEDDAPVEDGTTVDVGTDDETTDETSTGQETTEDDVPATVETASDEDAAATVPEDTGDETANEDAGGNGTVTLPSTGTGYQPDTNPALTFLVAVFATFIVALGVTRRRVA